MRLCQPGGKQGRCIADREGVWGQKGRKRDEGCYGEKE